MARGERLAARSGGCGNPGRSDAFSGRRPRDGRPIVRVFVAPSWIFPGSLVYRETKNGSRPFMPPPFFYQDPLPLGEDHTEYRLLSSEGVTLTQFEGNNI